MVKGSEKGYLIAYYSIGSSSKQSRFGHAALVLPPLFITMVFCFGLVLLQANDQRKQQTAASKHTAPKSAKAESTLTTPSSYTTATPLEADTSTGTSSDTTATAPAVTSQTNTATTQNLQSASQHTSSTPAIKQPAAEPKKPLINLPILNKL